MILPGLGACLEEWDYVQSQVAAFSPALVYDRGGYGFSTGSKAHDASEQADELAALLSALKLEGRIVLVGYSLSAQIARLFVERHREKVAGLVLVDPYPPEIEGRVQGRHGQMRQYARTMFTHSMKAMLGVKRLVRSLEEHRALPADATPVQQRAEEARRAQQRAQQSFPHLWSVVREWLATSATARETLAADRLEDLPVLLLSSELPDDAVGRVLDEVFRAFVARSRRGALRSLGKVGHLGLLGDGPAAPTIIGAIRELTQEAR